MIHYESDFHHHPNIQPRNGESGGGGNDDLVHYGVAVNGEEIFDGEERREGNRVMHETNVKKALQKAKSIFYLVQKELRKRFVFFFFFFFF